MKKLLIYFVQGLIITVPVAITAYVFYKVIALIGSFVHIFGTIVSPLVDPFIVIAITLSLIFLMGLLGSSIILRPLFTLFDHAMEQSKQWS